MKVLIPRVLYSHGGKQNVKLALHRKKIQRDKDLSMEAINMEKKDETIIIVDIETTGFSHSKNHIVEIGIASLNLKTGEIRGIYNTLVREDGLVMEPNKNDAWIFNNSDLRLFDVQEADPLQLEELQEIFDTSRATAWNKKFDFGFLKDRGLKIKELPCPMISFTKPGKKWPSVEEAWKELFPEIPYDEKHRGLDDAVHEAKMVHELYKRGIFRVKD